MRIMSALQRSAPIWLLTIAVLCSPAAGAAQTWGDLRLPGGVQAARQMIDTGTVGGRLDALWLMDVVRRVQGPTESSERIEQFRDYLEYVETLAPMVKGCPEQCRLVPRSAPSAERDRVRRLLDALGLDRKDND